MTLSACGRGRRRRRSAAPRNQPDPHAWSPLAPEVPWSCSPSPSGCPFWAGSEQLWPQLQGQDWLGGLLKTLGVPPTLPAPCLGLVVNRRGSGGCRQDGEAGQLWCVHMLPLGFVFGHPVSIPAAAGINSRVSIKASQRKPAAHKEINRHFPPACHRRLQASPGIV